MKRLLPIALLSAGVLTAAVPSLAAGTPPTPPASTAETSPSGSASGQNGMSGSRMMEGGMMGMMMGGGMMGQHRSPISNGGAGMMNMMMGMMQGGPGGAMGVAFADAPGPRVSDSTAMTLAKAVPAGATVDRAQNALTFASRQVRLVMVADSDNSGGDNRMFFETAGLRNPTITVHSGASVTVQFVNADDDEAHRLAFTETSPPFPFMAMMDAWPAFPGAEDPVLGDPTAAGLHSATIMFLASKPGRYVYLCLIPGHAQQGMFGHFVVTKTPT